MPDAHALTIFAAVAQNLSFTRAAETLFLTQSAVSHQVAALEKELGTPLFDRHGRSIALTPAGVVLVDRAKRVFAALEEASQAVRQAVKPGLGRLRIGASPTACQYLVPEPLREFRECFPDYLLSVIPADSPELAERVIDGAIDLAIMIRPEAKDRGGKLAFHDLFSDELGFLMSPLHPWARKGKVDRRELADQRLVLYSQSSASYRLIERYFLKVKVPLRDPIELGSMEAIKELVKLGLGISVMASWVAKPELEQGSLVWLPLAGGVIQRQWSIAAQSGKTLSLAEQTFVGLCQWASAGIADRD